MQIAALGDFQQDTAGLLLMFGTQSAVIRTAQLNFGEWFFGEGWSLRTHPRGEGWQSAPDDCAKVTVLGAGLFEIDIPIT
jgi:hypothetical protein